MFSKKLLMKNNDNWDLRWSSTINLAYNNVDYDYPSWDFGAFYDILNSISNVMLDYNDNNPNDPYPLVNGPTSLDQVYFVADFLCFDEDDMWGTGFDETLFGWILVIAQLYITMDARYLFTGWFTPGFTDFASVGSIDSGDPSFNDPGDGAPCARTLCCFELCPIIHPLSVSSFVTRYIDPILSNCAYLEDTGMDQYLNAIRTAFVSCPTFEDMVKIWTQMQLELSI